MNMNKLVRQSVGAAATAVALAMSAVAVAGEEVTAVQSEQMEQATRAPHKVANRFHHRLGTEQKAEFARVEIAPDKAQGPERRPHKAGNQFR